MGAPRDVLAGRTALFVLFALCASLVPLPPRADIEVYVAGPAIDTDAAAARHLLEIGRKLMFGDTSYLEVSRLAVQMLRVLCPSDLSVVVLASAP